MVAVLGLMRVYRRPIVLPLVSVAAIGIMALEAHKMAALGDWQTRSAS